MQTRELIFFGVTTVIAAGLHVYLGLRLVQPAPFSGRVRAALWVLLALMLCALLVGLLGGRFLERSPTLRAIQWTGFVAMGLVLILFPLTAVRDALWICGKLTLRAGHAVPNPERRALLFNASSAAVFGLSTLVACQGWVQARRRAAVKPVRVPIEGLPPDLDGFRIAQITDLHVGPIIRREAVRRVVEAVNELDADVIAVTGDLADGTVEDLKDVVAPLSELRARQGVYFVTGNHEYYWNAPAWVEEVRRLGPTVLVNEHRALRVGESIVLLAGVSDVSAHQFVPAHRSDPAAALSGAPRADVRILLAHQPRSLFAAREAGYDLQISGHTHGGQFFPLELLDPPRATCGGGPEALRPHLGLRQSRHRYLGAAATLGSSIGNRAHPTRARLTARLGGGHSPTALERRPQPGCRRRCRPRTLRR